MSFGFSIGDFIAVVKLADEVSQRFVDAPKQLKAIERDVLSLSSVLGDTKRILSQQNLAKWQETALLSTLNSCNDVLSKLEKILDDYASVVSPTPSFRNQARNVAKRLSFRPAEVQELRGQIMLNISLLQVFVSSLTSEISLDVKSSIDRMQNEGEEREILDWLTPIDHTSYYLDYLRRREPGTGNEFLQSEPFTRWMGGKGKTMFCPGAPGAGKTILTATVIDAILEGSRNLHQQTDIAFIFFNFKRKEEQEPEDLLAILLRQLLTQPIPDSIKNLYYEYRTQRKKFRVEQILDGLHTVLSNSSRSFIVIDALDECEPACRDKLLTHLFKIQATTAVNIFATSRKIPEIIAHFEERCIPLEIRATESDLDIYLRKRVGELRIFNRRKSKTSEMDIQSQTEHPIQAEIRTEITKVADGIFLIAELLMNALASKINIKQIRDILSKLPRGSKSNVYRHVYDATIQRIKAQSEEARALAIQVLVWISGAKRPLTILELQNACAIEIGTTKFDEYAIPHVDDIISFCAGLVTVDQTSYTVRLVHYTVQEFFEHNPGVLVPDVHEEIATRCLTYLSYDVFDSGCCFTSDIFFERLRLYPLYNYAARYWGDHITERATLDDVILKFFQDEAKVGASAQLAYQSPCYVYSNQSPCNVTGFHIVAWFGMTKFVDVLIAHGYDINATDSEHRTALLWAINIGNVKTAQRLIEAGAEVNLADRAGRAPLSRAAGRGYFDIVTLLMTAGADPNLQDHYGRTPLFNAAFHGKDAIIQLLLDRGNIDTSIQSKGGRTLLSHIAQTGCVENMKRLLKDNKLDVDTADNMGWTPLAHAAEMGNEAAVKLFISTGRSNVHSINCWGQTPLSRAARNGHLNIVKLLLECGTIPADISGDQGGWTPFLQAAKHGRVEVIEFLLARPVFNIDHKDFSGRTPLSWAASQGHIAVVRQLLTKDNVDPNSQDRNNTTPLSWATKNGKVEVVALLIEAKANINIVDANYDSPLRLAITRGHTEITQLLLEKGACVDLGSLNFLYGAPFSDFKMSPKIEELLRTKCSWIPEEDFGLQGLFS